MTESSELTRIWWVVDRGWDGWMAPPTRWIWVWVNSRSWWWTGRPGVLQFTGSQSQTRLNNWTELNWGKVWWEWGKKRLQRTKCEFFKLWICSLSWLLWWFHEYLHTSCCSPWGRKESDMAESLNWTEDMLNYILYMWFIVYQLHLNKVALLGVGFSF